jgi:hypothetical protein
LSGWNAIDVLRAEGYAIEPKVFEKVFPGGPRGPRRNEGPPIIAVRPKRSLEKTTILAIVREAHLTTKRTKKLDALGDVGARLLGLPKTGFSQITLAVNSQRPNLSYTCVLPRKLASDAMNKMVTATIEGKIVGDYAIWLVTNIRPIE